MSFQLFRQKTFAEEYVRRVIEDTDTKVDRDLFDGMEGELTQAHIKAGVINNCRKCPVALALNQMLAEHKDQIGQVLTCEVNHLHIFIFTASWSKVVLMMEMSGLLEQWLIDFDKGVKMPTGKIYIEKDGLIDSYDGKKVQHWNMGIEVPDAYYNDPIGFEDNSVTWGV